jgi:hypothetical protein
MMVWFNNFVSVKFSDAFGGYNEYKLYNFIGTITFSVTKPLQMKKLRFANNKVGNFENCCKNRSRPISININRPDFEKIELKQI